MKQKIINVTIILVLLCEAVSAQQDTLVLVKQSRIAYCNSKIAEVAVLKERVINFEGTIVTLNSRVGEKEREVESLNRSLAHQVEKTTLSEVGEETVRQENLEVKNENKKLHKKVTLQKVGLIVLTVLTVWSWAKG